MIDLFFPIFEDDMEFPDLESLKEEYPIYYLIQGLEDREWPEDERAGKFLNENWPAVKEELLLQQKIKGGKKLNLHDVVIRMPGEESGGSTYELVCFFNHMINSDTYFLNAELYEELIPFVHDLLEIFDFEENDPTQYYNYMCSIGRAYDSLGLKEKRDQHFAELLSPRNEYVAGQYAFVLLYNREIEAAEKLLNEYRDYTDPILEDKFEWLEDLKNGMNKQ